MKIFAIVVAYNGKKWYDKCLGSLLTSSVPIDVVVIDNASSDDTVEYISSNFPSICLIQTKENLGFAKANNIGIKYALEKNADYVFLLNQDAWVEENTLEVLLQTFEDNKHVGIASPMHLNGTYTGLDNGFCNYVGAICISDIYMNKLKPYYEVSFVNAAAWLVSIECIRKVGGFDTNLFVHYGEDNNYIQRVLYHGMKIMINTQCTICHDREKRHVNPLNSSFNNDSYLLKRYENGNILLPYNHNQQIRCKKRLLIKAFLGLHFKRAKRLRFEIELEKKISYSRAMNIEGGLVWL